MAARGGRGGGRGGGGMGRGAGGGGPFTTGSSLMGGLTYNDVMGASREAKDAKLYPQTDVPNFAEPSRRELQSQKMMKEYLRKLRFSAYHVAIAEKKDASVAKYTDRYEAAVDELPTLVQIKDRLNPDFFPSQTWANYFDKAARVAKRKKVKQNASNVLGAAAGEEGDDADETKQDADEQENKSGEEEEEVDEFDDEEENPDYDNNYFDDGAEDDDDGGGDGGEATYE